MGEALSLLRKSESPSLLPCLSRFPRAFHTVKFRKNREMALFLGFFIELRSMLLLIEMSRALCFRNKLDPRIHFRSEDLFLDCFGLSIRCHPLSLPLLNDRRLPEPFPIILQ